MAEIGALLLCDHQKGQDCDIGRTPLKNVLELDGIVRQSLRLKHAIRP
jgi:hypothetical protein